MAAPTASLLSCALVLAVGLDCAQTSSRAGAPTAPQLASGRAERFAAHYRRANPFVGSWGPPPAYLANDWAVRFTPDGQVSVKGPGVTARGTYVARGGAATVRYEIRNGAPPRDPALGRGTFDISADGSEVVFSTGIPNDPPVRLIRT